MDRDIEQTVDQLATVRHATLLGIDPGNELSAFCYIADNYRPILFGKLPNHQLMDRLQITHARHTAIEWYESMGMTVGKEVFESCLWVGRFMQTIFDYATADRVDVDLIGRHAVKLNLCNSRKAKDGNIVQALVDRFTPGEPNHGKGTKAQPSWFHGFAGDIWQAYAVAVTALDEMAERAPPKRVAG